MQLWAQINAVDIGRIHKGMEVTFTVDAFRNEVFKGAVAQVRRSPTSTQNVVTYPVVIDFENPDHRLMPYQTAHVEFPIGPETAADQTATRPSPSRRARRRGPSWSTRSIRAPCRPA